MKPLLWDDPGVAERIEKILSQGEVVLASGDTVLGLLADISVESFDRLNTIKSRSEKPYLLLVSHAEKALEFIEISSGLLFQFEKLAKNCWPGPVTLIFNAKKSIADGIKSPQGTIAIRVPDHQGLQKVLRHRQALFSTSANKSGNPVPTTIAQVDKEILDAVSGIVINRLEGDSTLPSTILDCTGEKVVVVRQGAFPMERLKNFL
jgi:L-threonylcarbamoyladenylate synthase